MDRPAGDAVVEGPPWASPSLRSAPVPASAEVVVVGASYAGLAAATFLAEAGVRVVVLEAASEVLCGASGRSIGAVTLGIAEHPWRLVSSLGLDGARELFRLSRDGADLAVDLLGMRRTGGLWAAADAAEAAWIDPSVAALSAMGVPVERWEPERVAEAVGSGTFGPGFFCPEEGLVDQGSHGLIARAQAAGAVVCTGSPVRGHRNDDRGVILELDGQEIVADSVVLCAGAGLASLDPRLADKVFPYREQALATAPMALPADHAFRAGSGYTSWRRTGDGRLVVTGARWATPHLEEGETEVRLVPAVQSKLDGFLAQRFPGHAAITHRWAWIDSKSCDGLPLIGPLPGDVRVVLCGGFHGQPVALGLRAARAVADGLLTGRAPGIPRFLEATRFL